MPIHDYRCTACGHVERDLFFKVNDIPRVRKCGACGKEASEQVFDRFGKAQIHLTHSSMYGKWHPQAGMVIESYNHKRELMKRWGWEEADSVGGNKHLSEESKHADYLADQQPEPAMTAVWGDAEDAKRAMRDKYSKTDLTLG